MLDSPEVQNNIASQERNSKSPKSSSPNFKGSTVESANTLGKNLKDDFIGNLQESSYGKFLRAIKLLPDAQPEDFDFEGASWGASEGKADWRVRLSMPEDFKASPLLTPLKKTNNSLIFPYTPSIFITQSANYTPIKPVHSNYPFFAYQNSQVEQFTITGDFYVEDKLEGQYWIAAVHYLRSVSKMSYGYTSKVGSPPPVVKLNGYGDYVFKNVPVVVTSFSVELSQEVDYIYVDSIGTQGTYVPTKSNINVTVQPIYSRSSVEKFSLQKFVQGGYLRSGGFI